VQPSFVAISTVDRSIVAPWPRSPAASQTGARGALDALTLDGGDNPNGRMPPLDPQCLQRAEASVSPCCLLPDPSIPKASVKAHQAYEWRWWIPVNSQRWREGADPSKAGRRQISTASRRLPHALISTQVVDGRHVSAWFGEGRRKILVVGSAGRSGNQVLGFDEAGGTTSFYCCDPG